MPARTLTKKLKGVWLGSSGEAPCPVCQPEGRRDQHALSITWKEGRLLLNCKKSRCDFRDILRAADFDLKPEQRANPRTPDPREKIEAGKRRLEAAMLAEKVMAAAKPSEHPYLASKGFPTLKLQTITYADLRSLMKIPKVFDGCSTKDSFLCIPLSSPSGILTSCQLLNSRGQKYFLRGGRIGGSGWFPTSGHGRPLILCEGIATGLSILRASKRINSVVSVGACMSAGGVAAMGKMGIGDAVVADNDASGTGIRAARETGLLWIMPPTVGEDFNDLERRSPSEADALLRKIAFGIPWTAEKRAPPPVRAKYALRDQTERGTA